MSRSTTVALSPTESAASARAAATDSVRIAHYGTGTFDVSPVLVHMPRTLGCAKPIPTTLQFAEAYQWLYENGFAANAQLGDWHWQIREAFDHGDMDRAEELQAAAYNHWLKVSPLPVTERPVYVDAEHDYLDSLGAVAMFADAVGVTPAKRAPHEDMHWGHYVKVDSWKRARRRFAIATGMLAAGVTFGLLVPDGWAAVPVTALSYLFVNRRATYSQAAELSTTKWAVGHLLRDKTREKFAQSALTMSDDEAFEWFRAHVRDQVIAYELKHARGKIEKVAVAAPEPEPVEAPTLFGRVIGDDSAFEASPDIDLLRASRALLDEYGERSR